MPTQMSRVVDRMVVARQLALSTSSFHIALLHTSAAWAQDTSSKPGLGFRRLVQGGQAAEGRQVLLHHGRLLLLPMAGQLSEVDKVGSFLRTGARFGKLREQVTTEEAVEREDGDAKAAAGNGKEGREEFDLRADRHITKRGGGGEAGEHEQEEIEEAGCKERESLRAWRVLCVGNEKSGLGAQARLALLPCVALEQAVRVRTSF